MCVGSNPLISITTLMAFLVNKLSLVFLLFLASSPFRIDARESRFLTKATNPEETKETRRGITEETPAVKTEEPRMIPSVRSLSGSGHGFYGNGQEQFTPTTTTNYDDKNNNNYYYNNARPTTNTFPSSFPDAELTSESYDNGGYNYGNRFSNSNNSPSKFSKEESKEYNSYVDNKQQYGMSDTRFLENGRYFYDVNAESNRNRWTYPTRGHSETGVRAGNYGNGVYGNGNGDRYDNAMEYQNNQMNQESQEEYVP